MALYVSRSAPYFSASRSQPAPVRKAPPAHASQPRITELRRHFSKPSQSYPMPPKRFEVLRPSYKPRSDFDELAIFQTIHCERLCFALSHATKEAGDPRILEPIRQQVSELRASFTEPVPSFSEYLQSLSEQYELDLTEEEIWDLYQSYDIALNYAKENHLDPKLIRLIEKHKNKIASRFEHPSSIMSV